MNADQVRALVTAKWPEAMQSPLATACAEFSAADEAARAVEFAQLQARAENAPRRCGDGCKGCDFCLRDTDTPAEREQMLADAMSHATACLAACGGWTVETLSHNVESAFGMDLGYEDCYEIARQALAPSH